MAPRLVAFTGVVDGAWDGYAQTWWVERVAPADDASGDLPRGLLVRISDAAPALAGDRVQVRGRLELQWSRGRWRPVVIASEADVALRRDGPRGWAWAGIEAIPGDNVLAGALLLGRGSSPSKRTFRQAGLLHLLAVSGLHLGIAMAGAWWVLGGVGLAWAPRQAAGLGLALGYLWLTGGSEATWRAAAMVAALVAAGASGRRPHPLTVWALAVVGLLVIDPGRADEVGFQLSALAVLGIVSLGRELVGVRQRVLPLQPWPLDRGLWRAWLAGCRWWLDGLAIGLAATVAVTPLTALTFGTVTWWAPVATLLAAPLVTLVVLLGLPYLLLYGLWADGPWSGLAWLIGSLLDGLIIIATWLAGWPGSLASVASPPLAAVLLWPALFLPLRDAWDTGLRLAAIAVASCWLAWGG